MTPQEKITLIRAWEKAVGHRLCFRLDFTNALEERMLKDGFIRNSDEKALDTLISGFKMLEWQADSILANAGFNPKKVYR